jgi:DNA helicase HerA-like ATPase
MVERTLIRPPESQLGPITPDERKAIIAGSGFSPKYDTLVDRESAFEKLRARADAAAKEAAQAEASAQQQKQADSEFRNARRYDGGGLNTDLWAKPKAASRPATSSRSDGIAVTFGKSLARQLGSKAGQAIVRGVLGGLFKSR